MYTFSVEGLKEKGKEAFVVGQIKTLDQDAEVSLDILNYLVKVQTSCPIEDIQAALEDVGLRVRGSSH